MPGIVGLITRLPRQQAEAELLRMVDTLRQESFHVTGTWSDEALGVYVGWVVQENSFAANMPVCSKRGDVILIFSGEEYSKRETHTLKADRPSYLADRYEEDPTFPSCLNGRFHGIVVDRARGTATVFNDRYGMHRLCYHESKEAFYFAAESKAILEVRSELREADPRGLGEFVTYSCVLDNRTIFKGIYLLPQASAWTFRSASLDQKKTYFDPSEWENQSPLAPEAYYQEMREVFSHNLPRYFNGHERIGMTLTGGLDTRAIVAWRNAVSGSLPCYTFGGMFRECQDVRVARRVANLCGQSHEVIEVSDKFLTRFPRYAERSVYLTEGGVDVSRASDLYVSERAREIAPVKIVGTYGSEIVCHAVMLEPAATAGGLFRRDFLPYIGQAQESYGELRHVHPVTFAAFRQSPWYHYGVLALEQSQLTVRSPFLDNDFVRTAFRAPKSDGADKDIRLRLIRDANPDLGRIRTDRGIGGNSGHVIATMTRRYLEFTTKAEYAYDYGMPQWLARVDHLFAAFHFERLFLGRHKVCHFRVWYRDTLADYVRETLLDPRALARPYLEPKGLESVVRGHLSGTRNHTKEIHKMLTLELIHRLFLDR